MRLLAICTAIGLGLYFVQSGGLPQVSGGGPTPGSVRAYTGAVGHALSPLKGE